MSSSFEFSIVTSIVVSFLLNVVSSIRFPTPIRGRLGLFACFLFSASQKKVNLHSALKKKDTVE
jgi:hypothetical protein